MTTITPRINVTLEASMYEAVNQLARQGKKSLSSVIKQLVADALENHEDYYLSQLADKRFEGSKGKYVSHDAAWGNIGKVAKKRKKK